MQRIPLAERMRPTTLSEVIGQSHLLGENEILNQIIKNKEPVSLIFWGPPGCGKTTLARIIAKEANAEFIEISAVMSGKKDIEEIIKIAKKNWGTGLKSTVRLDAWQGKTEKQAELYETYSERASEGLAQPGAKRTVLFVDEIHRFNKAQQDAFLPHVESGLITLIGATTENPSFEIITPLLSRSRVIVLESLSEEDIKEIVIKAIKAEKASKKITPKAIDYITKLSAGDARSALNTLELALSLNQKITPEVIKIAAQKHLPGYDKKGDMHYSVISAFIKSMRGGNVDATLYYLARMIDAGEDPKFIARRMIIFASEDIGLAGNGALGLALNAFQAIERIGMPESSIILAHVATALAKAEKSRETTDAIFRAIDIVKQYPDLPVPLQLHNAPTKLMKDLKYGKDYKWEAGFKHDKGFLPPELKDKKIF